MLDRTTGVVYCPRPISFIGGLSTLVSQFDRSRAMSAVGISADGRRVPVQLPHSADVSLLAKLERIVLELIALITGSRREPGGRRR